MKPILAFSLVILVTLEVVSQTLGFKNWDIYDRTILYWVSGMGIAILPLIKITPSPPVGKSAKLIKEFFFLVIVLFIFLFANYSSSWATDLFAQKAINYKIADMLPVIQIMTERCLEGTSIYHLIPLWSGTEPIYLPTMWLPYLPFTYFQIDIRWASITSLWISLLLIFFIGRQGKFTFSTLFILLPLGILLNGILHIDAKLIYLSEEPVVVTYYLFLAYTLSKRNPYLIGLALSLCLMSRFALAFWLLMYLAYVFLFENRQKAIKIGLSTFIICGILLFTTGAIWQLELILNLPNIYLEHILNNEWKFNGFAKANLGMVKFFSFRAVPLFQQLFLWLNVGIPLLCLFFFWKFSTIINTPLFPVCSLKLCLVFFYNFLLMPYSYLFYTSTFLSIAILCWYVKEDF